MTSVTQKLLTAEEFAALPGSERMELVRGEVNPLMPHGKEHGAVALAVGTLLGLRAKQGAGGRAGVESGFILGHDPDTVRGPDVYYFSSQRLQGDNQASAFWTIAPDLAVEVISPSETAEEVQQKVGDYLAAGPPMVWTVYPRTREVVVHTADGLARTYSGDDIIENQDALPGFSCKASELFE